MTLLCILLKELLGYPKMEIQNKLRRKINKDGLVIFCVHSEPLCVSKLSLRICCSFLVGLKSQDHPPCRHLGIYTVVRDFKTRLYV